MLHVGNRRIRAFGVALLLSLATPRVAQAHAAALPVATPVSFAPAQQETLFTLATLIYAASSVATPADVARLQPFLLTYHADRRLDGLYPMRSEVAAATRRWPLSLRLRALAFLLSHGAAITNFNAMALQVVGGAPSFLSLDPGAPAGAPERKIYQDRQVLAALLRQAWSSGQVEALWHQERLAWAAAQPQAGHLVELGAAIDRYTRTTLPTFRSGSQVIANPLMPLGSGVTSLFADGHFVMVVGPTQSPREADMLVTHELLHPILHQVIHADVSLQAAIEADACSFTAIVAADADNVLTRYVYTSWESYLSEVMVRAISHRLAAVPAPGRDPFVIAADVAHHLDTYEQASGSFADFTRHLSDDLAQHYCRSTHHV